jgi:uroporphyrinogen decarboxylase
VKGYTAEEMLKDADKIVESLIEVNKLYMPDGLPILFDLQVEAEILGCELLWAKDNPPSVKSHPYEEGKSLPCVCKLPDENSGRMPMILDATRRAKEAIGDETALYGLICGPFTLASHLRGTNIFMDMMMEPEYTKDLLDFCGQVAIRMAGMYIDAGVDVIAVVDPLISQVSPKHIKKVMLDTFKGVFDYIRSRDVFSCFFVCGNATKQIEVMCEMGPDGISIDENVNLPEAKKITDSYNICIAGNIPLTTTMLHGNQQDNIKTVIDEIDSIEDKTNFIVSPGCDMPYATPIENTIACAQTAKNLDETREMVANYEGGGFDDIEIEIPDYANADKVIIELFLLDPEQCAACTYMKATCVDNFDAVADKAEWREYRYNRKEDIARTMEMGMQKLPTMCIDGEQKFISLIPSREEFIAAVEEAAAKKGL